MDSQAWWRTDTDHLRSVEDALGLHAPNLRLIVTDTTMIARGAYELRDQKGVADRWLVELQFHPSDKFKWPKVWEIEERIPRIEDRHVNKLDQSCCLEVTDEWIALTGDDTFPGFLLGPFRNYFISQSHFERTGEWPFDQRPHGLAGMVEAYSDLLGVPCDVRIVGRTLSFLTLEHAKGHWPCACGSDRRLRDCCRDRLNTLRERIRPQMAARLFRNLQSLVTVQDKRASNENEPLAPRLEYRKQ
jgi:hypothetical protein